LHCATFGSHRNQHSIELAINLHSPLPVNKHLFILVYCLLCEKINVYIRVVANEAQKKYYKDQQLKQENKLWQVTEKKSVSRQVSANICPSPCECT